MVETQRLVELVQRRRSTHYREYHDEHTDIKNRFGKRVFISGYDVRGARGYRQAEQLAADRVPNGVEQHKEEVVRVLQEGKRYQVVLEVGEDKAIRNFVVETNDVGIAVKVSVRGVQGRVQAVCVHENNHSAMQQHNGKRNTLYDFFGGGFSAGNINLFLSHNHTPILSSILSSTCLTTSAIGKVNAVHSQPIADEYSLSALPSKRFAYSQ